MTVCYFTATGNCLYVAKRIGGTLLSIPQLMRQDRIEIEDDAVGIAAPCYAVEMPMMVKEFLEKSQIRTEYFFFIYTYGMGYAQVFTHVEVTARKVGLTLSYINAIQMVDNYIPFFDMQEQIDTLPQKNVEGQIAQVAKDIHERQLKQICPTEDDLAEMEKWSKNHAANYHFYEKKTLGGSDAAWDVQKVDLGIAICHFMSIAGGDLSLAKPDISTDKDTEYIATVTV